MGNWVLTVVFIKPLLLAYLRPFLALKFHPVWWCGLVVELLGCVPTLPPFSHKTLTSHWIQSLYLKNEGINQSGLWYVSEVLYRFQIGAETFRGADHSHEISVLRAGIGRQEWSGYKRESWKNVNPEDVAPRSAMYSSVDLKLVSSFC